MEFGLNFEKLLLIGLIAVLLVGPDRLPQYAETFARLVRRAGEYLRETKTRVREEMGPDIDDVDWRKLDPRQYDPRRIIRDALFEEGPSGAAPAPTASPSAASASSSPAAAGGGAVPGAGTLPDAGAPAAVRTASAARPLFTRENPPPFDLEAT